MRMLFLFLLLNFNLSFGQTTFEKTYDFKPLTSYENALSEAKKANKKLLLFFSAHSDVNSEIMKEEVFIDKEVKNLLEQNFVSFKAYLDDRTEIPINEYYFSKPLNKKVKMVGEKFQDLQVSKFKVNMQPYFVILDNNGKQIKQLIGRGDKRKFLSFLNIKF